MLIVTICSGVNPAGDSFYFVVSSPLLLLQSFLFAFYGISTAFFLKKLSNITREVASGVIIVLSLPSNYLVFGYDIFAKQVVGTALVTMGVAVYGRYPVPSAEPEHKSVESSA